MSKRMTTKEFIEKAKAVHGDKYDYSKVDYVNSSTPVCIICSEHGEFWQIPGSHTNKHQGCPKCYGTPKKTTEQFVEEARKIHGDKYDYSKVNYENALTKVCIICPKHGEFWQKPNDHLNGHGCCFCSGVANKTTEQFIEEARKVHGDKYDYSKVNYINSGTKVCIICPKHGKFLQTPNSHLNGMQGCAKCAKENVGISKRIGIEQFIERARKVHGDKYDYSKVNYVNGHEKVCIICPEHGEFWQAPSRHLYGQGCPVCADCVKLTTESFIERARKIHGDRYDYSKVDYVNNHEKVCIICKEHGEFWQTPAGHLKGCGCSACAGCVRLTTEQFIEKARKIHGDKYDYSKVVYESNHKKVCIICPKHGEFWQIPIEHLRGRGCPVCNLGFTKSYILSLLNESVLEYLTVHQLIELIKMGQLPASLGALKFSKPGSKERKDTIKSLKEKLEGDESEEDFENEEKEAIEKAEAEFEKEHEELSDDSTNESIADAVDGNMTADVVIKSLKIPDNPKFNVSEGEGERFIVTESIHLLWNKTLEDEAGFIAKYKAEPSSGAFFDRIRDMFLKEYEEVKSMNKDNDCVFPYNPNLMQKLMVYYVKNNPYFGNWCGTGAGKSFSRDWIARAIDARVSVYVVPNAVVDTTVKAINQAYNDVNVVIPHEQSDIAVLDRGKHNVIVLNYEKFQQNYTGAWIAGLLKNRIDFICLDEIQNVKVRDTDNISLRNRNMNTFIKNAREANPELKVFAMSATPLINNLTEVRELMGLLTGTIYDEIGDRASMDNIHNAYKALIINGFRYVPKYDIKIDEQKPEIDGLDIKDEMLGFKDGDILKMEKALVAKKIEWCKANSLFKKGTIVYTHYVNQGIVTSIKKTLEQIGFKVGCYTGHEDADERANIVKAFQNGNIDILIGSKPIVEGVDGLQYVCDRLIAVSLPWTASDWNQLLGRIYRQGSKFKDIAVIVPQIVIDKWSYDKRRMNIILYKKTLGEAVVDGSFEHFDGYNGKAMQTKLLSQALKALRNGVQDKEVVRREVETDEIDTTIQKRNYADSLINSTHQKANTCRHENIAKNVFENSQEKFKEYHRTRREAIQNKWVLDPLDKVAKIIDSEYDSDFYHNVIDLGCGENLLKTKIADGENRVVGIDVEQIDETVVKADCANLKSIIADGSKQIAVHCLSLWGTLDSCVDYFKEDYRVLQSRINAPLIIVEPSDKFGENGHFGTIDDFVAKVEEVGFRKNGNVETENGFCFFRFTK